MTSYSKANWTSLLMMCTAVAVFASMCHITFDGEHSRMYFGLFGLGLGTGGYVLSWWVDRNYYIVTETDRKIKVANDA